MGVLVPDFEARRAVGVGRGPGPGCEVRVGFRPVLSRRTTASDPLTVSKRGCMLEAMEARDPPARTPALDSGIEGIFFELRFLSRLPTTSTLDKCAFPPRGGPSIGAVTPRYKANPGPCPRTGADLPIGESW